MAHKSAHTIVPGYVPHSTSTDGRFGRLFGKLPPWVPPGKSDPDRVKAIDDFVAANMTLPQPESPPQNEHIPAGYTYFGQFVDHDITFDPASSLTRQNDPDGLQNFRSPRLDLDSIYGRGPDDQPYLYRQDAIAKDGKTPIKGILLTGTGINGTEFDLPRVRPPQAAIDAAIAAKKDVPAVALIGDPRNDENVIVSQFQLTFLRLHNRLLRRIADEDLDEQAANAAASPDGKAPPVRTPDEQFHEAQRVVRWFYQYVVWNDFVKRLVPGTVWDKALKFSTSGTGYELGLKDIYSWKVHPFMPVEFSGAAYRLGHSLIRAGYQLNIQRQLEIAEPGETPVGEKFELPIFDPAANNKPDLNGGRLLSDKHTIQWDWYFSMGSPGDFPQLSNLIDTKISSSVAKIPGTGRNLAALNIQRGWRLGLPSGTSVAHAMGFPALKLADEMENSLWVYILKEAEQHDEGNGEAKGSRLGEVGGTIVAAVFAGLLKGDPLSYVEQFPKWTPADEPLLQGLGRKPAQTDGTHDLATWDIRDLLVIADMPINGNHVKNVIDGIDPSAPPADGAGQATPGGATTS